MRWIAAAFTCALAAGGAGAQDRTVFELDAEAVDGELVQPDGAMITARPAGPGSQLSPAALDRAIREARSRIARGAGATEHLRLAELLVERSSRARIARFRAEAAAHEARLRGDTGAVARAERRAAGHEEAWRRDARAVIDAVSAIDERAAPAVRARALSLAAWQYDSLGDSTAAVRASERLIAACASCAEAADAHLRIAERLFEEAKLPDAIARYELAIAARSATPEVRAYARYKIGWCLYNLGDFVAAWDALDRARREADHSGNASTGRLAREARRDQLRVLGSMGAGSAEAIARIRTLSPDPSERANLARRYTDLLREQGRERDAAAFTAAWR